MEPKPEMTDDERLAYLRKVWLDTERVCKGDIVANYLAGRGLDMDTYPDALRTHKSGMMVALVSDAEGNPATLHRTMIVDGKRGERKLMPGSVPKGAAIRLGNPGDELGIAEGIETALAARKIFGFPVWSAINSSMLENFIPPSDVKIYVLGDNDEKYGGQKAAYALAHRLAVEGRDVTVEIPGRGDWNDVIFN